MPKPSDRPFVVRTACEHDVVAIARLIEQFAGLMLELGDNSPLCLDAAALRRDGFGRVPAFGGMVAEIERDVVGYLLHHPGYNTDTACRQLVVIDLFVATTARRQGIGASLLKEARRVGASAGAREVVWTVDRRNMPAQRFYERCGARTIDGTVLMGMPV